MRIDPSKQAWMVAPETRKLMAVLGEGRFVGGAVRNALAGWPVRDIDVAVPMPPEETLARLEKAEIKAVPTGLAHGTVTAIVHGRPFEVTSLRSDVETDGRHAVVAYTDDWREDAARRDFTMNALYAGANGEIFDYHGGVEDLIAGRVRFVGDAATRIREDYLRILRLFRFHAWYGKGEMDSEALHAAAAGKEGLARLSGERVAKEMLRLLECTNPVLSLRMMAASGVLPELLPYALQLPRLENLVLLDAENDFPPDAVLRLAALLPDDAAVGAAVGERLKLSGAERARLEGLTRPEEKIAAHLSAADVRRLLYRIGVPRFRDRVLLSWAACVRGAAAIQWRMLLSIADGWERPRFPLTGREAMAAGAKEGPEVGRVLAAVEAWWLDEDFLPDEAQLLEKLKSVIEA
ncbi:MAG: CCA tRNA nucleotidyltransferase [Alphaproteobacteria bacterium]|jgi:poly(A) polymerase|nr:CCA tRNA nucleotidyltransferase [Alphaproteobacteria bacterium]